MINNPKQPVNFLCTLLGNLDLISNHNESDVNRCRKSSGHTNVFAFASGKEHEYSYLSTFTDHWTRIDHAHTCTEDAFQVSLI